MSKDTEEMLPGKFITFEGTEGVGKTTQIQLLSKYLKTKNIENIVTREPGGTKLGECLREVLLNNNDTEIDSMSELLLMFSARAQHLAEVIYPALKNNIWILCDRFTDATYAYQGGGRGVPHAKIKKLEDVVQDGFIPNLTILLSGQIGIGMRRVARRGEKDRFESEEVEFFERIQQNYLQLAEANSERFAVVDADQSIDKAALAIQAAVKQRFAELID
ncbi:MAG: dTMP kinase [Gammaproteobacteria bacterium]